MKVVSIEEIIVFLKIDSWIVGDLVVFIKRQITNIQSDIKNVNTLVKTYLKQFILT